ncbi:hypothetical protein BD410DRAFT_710334 [Rickenella mellea]|uniref:BTB domain-containing protein n=1 Tax=Rickenella mellea TaxID=50990 RepID=A0A4R5XGA3_9AGAM|nr:hypothetical protein BD410DRAFT_710334 [Rickenella mellea]
MLVSRSRHYYPDGTTVFQVENTLYRLHASLLQQRSPIFRHMFSVPPGTNASEGKDDSAPICLHGVKSSDFDHLCFYPFGCFVKHSSSEDFLVALIKLSTLYDIEDGREYAIAQFPTSPTWRPALQLHIARSYRVEDWIEPAFRQLIANPTISMPWCDAELLGLPTYHLVVQTITKVEAQQKLLAFYPAEMKEWIFCTTPENCTSCWELGWWNHVARHLLHPDAALSGQKMTELLGSIKIPGMCHHCQGETVSSLVENGALLMEEAFISEAIQQLDMF